MGLGSDEVEVEVEVELGFGAEDRCDVGVESEGSMRRGIVVLRELVSRLGNSLDAIDE